MFDFKRKSRGVNRSTLTLTLVFKTSKSSAGVDSQSGDKRPGLVGKGSVKSRGMKNECSDERKRRQVCF
jgi:hypothetical protein